MLRLRGRPVCTLVGYLVLWLLPSAGVGAQPLSFVEAQLDDTPPVDGLDGAVFLAFSSTGAHVYVAGFIDDAVVAFERDPLNGSLTFVGAHFQADAGIDGLNGPSMLALSPDDRHLYVPSDKGDDVDKTGGLAIFERDGGTGGLTFLGAVFPDDPGIEGLELTVSVAVSADGNHLYAGTKSGGLVAFGRDAQSGALTFLEAELEGVNGVSGLASALDIAISADQKHVYTCGGGGMAVFSRDPVSGMLAFIESHADGAGGVDGLAGGQGIVISPDDAHVYVSGSADNAVAVFSRDASSGALTFVEARFEGSAGVTGLVNPVRVASTPDGSHLLASAQNGDAIVVFERDAGTGSLSFREAILDGDGGAVLDGPKSVAVSPDGNHVLATVLVDDAVSVFALALFADGFESGDTSAW